MEFEFTVGLQLMALSGYVPLLHNKLDSKDEIIGPSQQAYH